MASIKNIVFVGIFIIDSRMRSFEKNPLRNGIPIRAILPRIRQAEVMGRDFFILDIFRRSCSFLCLWIILPEHKNNIALKNACVHMWNRAIFG